MLGAAFGVLAVAFLFGLVAIPCSGREFGPFLRMTFAPVTKQDFWFPSCPLCWVVRGCVVAALILTVAHFA